MKIIFDLVTLAFLQSAFAATSSEGGCILPPYPENGQYKANGVEKSSPGQVFDYVALEYSCTPGFAIVGSKKRLCVQGVWTEQDPTCVQTETHLSKGESKGACILPSQPANGQYKIDGVADFSPGQAFDYVALSYTCYSGYKISGSSNRLCVQGVWAGDEPKCVNTCKLDKHPSVFYSCTDASNFQRECGSTETDDVTVTPICHAQYFSPNTQDSPMRCIRGKWNYIAVCEPDCGRLPPENGNVGSVFVVPWHAAVYKKTDETYHQFCGGTLINTNTVVSSAQCYWNTANNGPEPTSNYAVALGKQYREWDNTKDKSAQKFSIADIKLHPSFRGAASKYENDIAVLLLSANIVFTQKIWPVCTQFASQLEHEHLQTTRLGMFAGWYTGWKSTNPAKNEANSKLRGLYLPLVPHQECLTKIGVSLIGSDTFCAGLENSTAALPLCRNNNGGGIVYPINIKGVVRYFLYGIASIRTINDELCSRSLHTFTQASRHKHFIKNPIA